MSATVMAVVLVGALLHASWNAAVKLAEDKQLAMLLVGSGAATVAALVLPFLPLPAAECWPYLLTSILIQTVYCLLLAATYRHGDMGLVYPLMRGSAPLIVATASGPLMGEQLSLGAWSGVMLICGGILGLMFAHRPDLGSSRTGSRRGAVMALLTAVLIAGYTLVDGVGVRLSGFALSYILWAFLLQAVPLTGWIVLRRRGEVLRYACGRLHYALIGGLCSLGSYGTALWAMTQAPVATVAALRESSILFAFAISVFILRENAGRARCAATGVVVAGAMLLRLA